MALEYEVRMLTLSLVLGIAAIVFLFRIKGKCRIPGFVLCMAGAALALLGAL